MESNTFSSHPQRHAAFNKSQDPQTNGREWLLGPSLMDPCFGILRVQSTYRTTQRTHHGTYLFQIEKNFRNYITVLQKKNWKFFPEPLQHQHQHKRFFNATRVEKKATGRVPRKCPTPKLHPKIRHAAPRISWATRATMDPYPNLSRISQRKKWGKHHGVSHTPLGGLKKGRNSRGFGPLFLLGKGRLVNLWLESSMKQVWKKSRLKLL